MKTKVGGVINRIYPETNILSIKRFKKGVINETYDVRADDKSLVLRIYPVDFWKAKKEKYLYSLVKEKTDVPVPEVIASGRDYLLMSKVEGKELSVEDESLVRKAGEVLAKIHSIKLPYYGWIINKEISPKFSSWADFIYYDMGQKLKKIPSQYDGLKKIIGEIVNKNKHLLDVNSKPCLLHKDYHSSHIITDSGKIKGIIDFEWAMAGHNEFDIAKSCLWMFDKKPEMETIFIKGYEKYGKVSKEFDERKGLYRLLILLSALSFSYECRHRKWCMHNLTRLKGELNEYNKTN